MAKDKRKVKPAPVVCPTCHDARSIQIKGEWIDCPTCKVKRR
jgi:hypothetical protein